MGNEGSGAFRGDAVRDPYGGLLDHWHFRQCGHGAVYVLHAFQKKSPKGIKTAKADIELVRQRLKAAREDYEARYGKHEK